MAEMNMVTPEYQNLINTLTERFGKQKSQAEASGIGEAIRRGLVNPTGTSDIEMSLRNSKVAPIQEAESSTIASLLKEIADTESGRKYQTSEREATQGWQTGEREAGQGWQSGESEKQRGWGTSERLGSQGFQTTEAEKQAARDKDNLLLQREWAASDQKKQSKNWWKDALGGVTSGLASSFKWSDKRLKKDIKPVGKIYEFRYKDNKTTRALGIKDKNKHIGLMAQDVEKIMPEAVRVENGFRKVDYNQLTN